MVPAMEDFLVYFDLMPISSVSIQDLMTMLPALMDLSAEISGRCLGSDVYKEPSLLDKDRVHLLEVW